MPHLEQSDHQAFQTSAGTIQFGPSAFGPSCCSLESTLAHDVNQLLLKGATEGEKSSYDLEMRCGNTTVRLLIRSQIIVGLLVIYACSHRDAGSSRLTVGGSIT